MTRHASIPPILLLAALHGCGGSSGGPAPAPTATPDVIPTTSATPAATGTPSATVAPTPSGTTPSGTTPSGTERVNFIPINPLTVVRLSPGSFGTRLGLVQAGDEGSGAAFPVLEGVVSYNIGAIRSLLPANARIQSARFSFSQRIEGAPYSFGPLDLSFLLQRVAPGAIPPTRVAARNANAATVDVADALLIALDPNNPARAFQIVLGFSGRTNRDARADIATIVPNRLEIVYTLQ